ncbi:hypothetical protein ACROYT_G015852 [Oculina patagonica]
MRNKWCTSTNFKLSSKNDGRGTCELNKHDISLINDKIVFHEQEGVTFSMYFKDSCQRKQCQNHGICEPDDLGRNTYHCVCKAGFAGTHCEACKFDFEDGIDGWEKTGTVFNNQPTYGDNPTARNRGQPANQQGDCGQNISFLIGGGCDINSVRAELIINGQAVRNETGSCTETMTGKTWDVAAFVGERACFRLVDFSSGLWGHINFDDLKGDISCKQD